MKAFFAVDGSQESFAAVRQVGQLLSPHTDAAAFYFAPPEIIVRRATSAQEIHDRALKTITESVFAEAIRYLPEALAKGAKFILAKHTPREGIVIEAQNWGADLIVVGARGMSGFDRVVLGSVSRSVVHSSPLPVYVARPSLKHTLNEPLRILYAYDGSDCSERALTAARGLTYPPGTEVTAVHVMDTLAAELPVWIMNSRTKAPETEAMIQLWQQQVESEKLQSREALSTALRRQGAPFNQAEVIITEGNAAEQILRLVETRRVDLVVIGSGGKKALARFLLGSTSEKVLNLAACSVLIAEGV